VHQQHLREMATLAGGCFWCFEAVFSELHGVEKVVSGYSGGSVPNPSYREVCAGTTGHAEAVHITFDPQIISFKDLLEIFFTIHDPTTLNRQGADVGTQYRSAIFYHTPEQARTAQEVIGYFYFNMVVRQPGDSSYLFSQRLLYPQYISNDFNICSLCDFISFFHYICCASLKSINSHSIIDLISSFEFPISNEFAL
jgi:methionine-S-sulfoxide reductase